jgi:prevent-host-death family protein
MRWVGMATTYPWLLDLGAKVMPGGMVLAASIGSYLNDYSHQAVTMKWMRASVFKARCLKVMNEVRATGEPVAVTKRGKPVVNVIPAGSENSVSGLWSDG